MYLRAILCNVLFRFLYIFTMYLWVGEEGERGAVEGGGLMKGGGGARERGIECILYGYS